MQITPLALSDLVNPALSRAAQALMEGRTQLAATGPGSDSSTHASALSKAAIAAGRAAVDIGTVVGHFDERGQLRARKAIEDALTGARLASMANAYTQSFRSVPADPANEPYRARLWAQARTGVAISERNLADALDAVRQLIQPTPRW